MADSEWSTELAKFGYAAQQRFDFYLVALCFTVLGLAIQTAHFGGNSASDFFELLGWLSLLTAETAGISRLEWEPQVYQLMGLQAGQQSRLTSLRTARAKGTTVIHALDTGTDLSIDGVIVNDERDLGKIENRMKEIGRKSSVAYCIRSIGFLLGFGSLVVARALGPLMTLLGLHAAA